MLQVTEPKPAVSVKRPKRKYASVQHFERLKQEDPEKLKQIAQKAVARKKELKIISSVKGKPATMTNREWALCKDNARKIAHRIFSMMDKEGALPENPIAREAMKQALEMLAEDNATKDKLAIIRTLLEYNLAKPAATSNVNLRTAEDFLDEIAAEENGGG